MSAAEWSREARRDWLEHVRYLAREQGDAVAAREGARILDAVEWFAGLHLDGVPTRIRGWRRQVRKWPLKPFVVFYERRPTGLFVVRLYHATRRPIER